MTLPDPAVFEQTRHGWHAVAELVLAGPQHRRSGEIALRVVPGGFATMYALDLQVVGRHLLMPTGSVPINGHTCAELATAAGVEVGEPRGLYHDGSHADPGEVLELDEISVSVLTDAYTTGEAALRRFAPTDVPILWPEHFDVAVRVDEINYGVSPGDGYSAVPYAYVGPNWHDTSAFWNAPFGAARPVAELDGVDAMVAFFAQGRTLANLP